MEELRQQTENILSGKDKRFMIIVGPCSISDQESTLEYAKLLKNLANEVSDQIFIVMRAYLEKPRSTVGWKGYVYDPDLNEDYNIVKGIKNSEKLLKALNKIGVPLATEFLSPILAPTIAPYITIGTIGSRTTTSQVHRELASSLALPIGFKNEPYGHTKEAVEAMVSSMHPHTFLGTQDGKRIKIIKSKGNKKTFLILRGGKNGANYFKENITQAIKDLKNHKLKGAIVVDCSHNNSGKDHKKQEIVAKHVLEQYLDGNKKIKGIMLESNLLADNQKVRKGKKIKYGVSITDTCISFQETEKIIKDFYKQLSLKINLKRIHAHTASAL